MLDILTTEQIEKVGHPLPIFSSSQLLNLTIPSFTRTGNDLLFPTELNPLHNGDLHRYLVVPGFLSNEDTEALLVRAKQLLDDFNIDDHPFVSGPVLPTLNPRLCFDFHCPYRLNSRRVMRTMLEMTIS